MVDTLTPSERSTRMSSVRSRDTKPEWLTRRLVHSMGYRYRLHGPLREHLESIEAASNLNTADFGCRYLTVDDIWIPLGESLLIARFSPLWNTLVDGFGNHDPGKGRHAGLRPRWDSLHPGRAWADRLQTRDETAAAIQREIKEVLATLP